MTQIHKIYLSNFLTGLVFWYGIEKLFMTSIGINAVGIGILTVLTVVLNLILDIPSGILADKWSRKGLLMVSAVALGLCSFMLGISSGFLTYAFGYALYSIYVVSTSGTYQAITYDSLHENGESGAYSKVSGRAYGLFLIGAGAANVSSGFIASHFGYRAAFFIAIISCILNVLVMASLHEPKFHKPEKKEFVLKELSAVTREILSNHLLRIFALIMSILGIVELFKTDFGQLYILRYISTPELLGLIWAVYAFCWAFGGFVAHRLKNRMSELVLFSTVPLIIASLIDSWHAILLFGIQAIASAALLNRIETNIQDKTPSHLRASLLSVLNSAGRIISIPASLLFGWSIKNNNPYITLRYITALSMAILLVWLWYVILRKEKLTTK